METEKQIVETVFTGLWHSSVPYIWVFVGALAVAERPQRNVNHFLYKEERGVYKEKQN